MNPESPRSKAKASPNCNTVSLFKDGRRAPWRGFGIEISTLSIGVSGCK